MERLASHAPEVYAVVSLLDAPAGGFGSGLVRSVDRARQRLADLAPGAVVAPIGAGELERIAVAEQRMFERVRGVLACSRASTKEIEWLLPRVEVRGLSAREAPTDISRGKAVLDRKGLDELDRLVPAFLDRIAELEREAQTRAEASGEPAELVPVAVLMTTGWV